MVLVLGTLVASRNASAAGQYTWTPVTTLPPSAVCAYIAASETGQYMTCGNTAGGGIFVSSDYGVNWTEQMGAGTHGWGETAMSGNGQYIASTFWGGDVWMSSDYGVTWTSHAPGGNSGGWELLQISNTGQYMTANNSTTSEAYISNDYGATWTTIPSLSGMIINNLSMSGTGQYITVTQTNGYIYTSDDYGSTWTSRPTAGSLQWTSLGASVSADGQYQVAIASGNVVRKSIDYGATWTDISPTIPVTNLYKPLISNDGQTVVISEYYNIGWAAAAGNLYISYDGGTTWGTDPGLPADVGWSAIAGSGDRSRLVVRGMQNNTVYVGYNPALFVPPAPTPNPDPNNPVAPAGPGTPNAGVGSMVTGIAAFGVFVLLGATTIWQIARTRHDS